MLGCRIHKGINTKCARVQPRIFDMQGRNVCIHRCPGRVLEQASANWPNITLVSPQNKNVGWSQGVVGFNSDSHIRTDQKRLGFGNIEFECKLCSGVGRKRFENRFSKPGLDHGC